MDILVKSYPNALVISVVGVIDSLTQEEVEAVFNLYIQKEATNLVLDLSQVDFMSSAGLRLMVQTARDLRRQGGDLRLAAAQAPVQHMLEVAGFTTFLKVFPTVAEAVASYS